MILLTQIAFTKDNIMVNNFYQYRRAFTRYNLRLSWKITNDQIKQKFDYHIFRLAQRKRLDKDFPYRRKF